MHAYFIPCSCDDANIDWVCTKSSNFFSSLFFTIFLKGLSIFDSKSVVLDVVAVAIS